MVGARLPRRLRGEHRAGATGRARARLAFLAALGLVATTLLAGAGASATSVVPVEVPATPPGAAPAPASRPTLPADATWLVALNFYRASAGLRPVAEDPELSRRAALHARYTVRTQRVTHFQERRDPNFSVAGDDAARNGLIAAGPSPVEDAGEIEGWMRAPFHALRIIDPAVTAVGFGRFDEIGPGRFHHAAVLYVKRPPIRYLDGKRIAAAPAIWPSRHASVPLRSFFGVEIPNPLSACPGYPLAAGLPIIVNTGDDVRLQSTALTEDGRAIPFCVISGPTYRNPNTNHQHAARALLGRSSFVVVPKRALIPGRTYRLRMTTSGPDFDEQFTVAPARPARVPRWQTSVERNRIRVIWEAPADGGSPITRYRVDAGGARFDMPADATGVELVDVLPAGPASVLVRAENAIGAGDPVSIHLHVPPGAARASGSRGRGEPATPSVRPGAASETLRAATPDPPNPDPPTPGAASTAGSDGAPLDSYPSLPLDLSAPFPDAAPPSADSLLALAGAAPGTRAPDHEPEADHGPVLG